MSCNGLPSSINVRYTAKNSGQHDRYFLTTINQSLAYHKGLYVSQGNIGQWIGAFTADHSAFGNDLNPNRF